jgi:hypothetical protein
MKIALLRGLVWTVPLLLLVALPAQATKTPYDWALTELDYACWEKVEQLERFIDRLHDLAQRAATDERLVTFFELNLNYENALRHEDAPPALREKMPALRDDFNRYYIEHYFAFYDMLFIGPDGTVFHTIRKEPDYRDNLLAGDRVNSPLGKALAPMPTAELFVDFHAYGPSMEPAAFFLEPIVRDDTQLGWLALQCAINKVNTLFTSTQDLGHTGETFLVNRDGYLLTESFFDGGNTILNKQLADTNINAKFNDRRGHRTVTDYRGATALSSFEVFDFLGTGWLVVAKMDRDEVTTNHYLRHKRYYADQLVASLQGNRPPEPVQPSLSRDRPMLRVDMDEFMKANGSQCLETWGISSCTGLLLAYPGRFAYMAHVSNRDCLYGGEGTDLLGQIVKNLHKFDIYPYEKGQVIVTLVAPHLGIVPAAVNRLVERGFMLSQIQLLIDTTADDAAMAYSHLDDTLEVTWSVGETTRGVHRKEHAVNVGQRIERLMAEPVDIP